MIGDFLPMQEFKISNQANHHKHKTLTTFREDYIGKTHKLANMYNQEQKYKTTLHREKKYIQNVHTLSTIHGNICTLK